MNIDKAATHVPDGTNPDAADACAKHEQIIKSLGGIDLQLLGLGNNGHIGFNEPGAAFEKGDTSGGSGREYRSGPMHVFASIDRSAQKQAYTMGIRTIMHGRKDSGGCLGRGAKQTSSHARSSDQ